MEGRKREGVDPLPVNVILQLFTFFLYSNIKVGCFKNSNHLPPNLPFLVDDTFKIHNIFS